MRNLAAILAELKRRRVFRVAVVYAGVAFIVFQAADFAFPALHVPDWFSSAVVVLLILGFPIAVGLAWAFDLTEEGLVRTKPKREPTTAKAPHHIVIGNNSLAVIAVLAIIVAAWALLREPSPGGGPITSIAVLPLDNLMGDPEQEYFVEGMHEALISALSRVSALTVISRTSAMRYRDTDMLVPEIAEELGVDAIVEGSVLKAGDQVRITAQLIDGRTDKHLWTEKYDRDLRNILSLHSEVAQAIARQIKVTVTPEEGARLASARPVNPDAYQLYLKGRYYWNKRTEQGLKQGLEYFQQAIEKDPGYALAYAGLADTYNMLGGYSFFPPKEAFPKGKKAALQALEIDSTLAEAHVSLAAVRKLFDWDWAGAETGFQRAIKLNPNYATAYHWYANMFRERGMINEALSREKKALNLDPLSLISNRALGVIYLLAQEYDPAIEQLLKTLEMDPYFVPAHLTLGNVYMQKTMYEEAIKEFRTAINLSRGDPRSIAYLGYAYGVVGDKAQALGVLDSLLALSARKYVEPTSIAKVYIGLNDKEQAFKWLYKAYEDHDSRLRHLKAYPIYAPLRSDPRFANLLRRMNFPE